MILGATGATGQHLVSQALQQGHAVTAFVRDPERLTSKHDRLRVVTGTVEDPAALDGAIRGQDVVISALGRGQSFKSHGLIAKSVPLVVAAMERQGVRRLVFMSAFGVGETWRDVPAMPRLFMRTLLRDIYTDKTVGESILRRSQLDWTIVQPVGLTNGPHTGRYRVGERLDLRGFPAISRADVADFILTQLGPETNVRKTLLVG